MSGVRDPAARSERPAAPMSPGVIAIKLRQIRGLSLAEIEGWRQIGLAQRAPFEGELAALSAREKELRGHGRKV